MTEKKIVLDDEDKGTLAHEALQEALNAMDGISNLEVLAYKGETVKLEGTVAPLGGEALLARIDRERGAVTHDLLASIGLSLREAIELLDAAIRHLDRQQRNEAPCSIGSGHEEHVWWDKEQARWTCPGKPAAAYVGRPIRDNPQA